MSYAQKVRVLKVVNAAFRKYDAESGSVREGKKMERKRLRCMQDKEIELMKMEDLLAVEVRTEAHRIEEKRLREVQRKKDEARLLRELAARLPEDDTNLRNETVLQRELRLKDRLRLLLRDNIDDCQTQAKSMEEGQMGIAINWIYTHVKYRHVLKWRLKKSIRKICSAQYYNTQLVLILFMEVLLIEWMKRRIKKDGVSIKSNLMDLLETINANKNNNVKEENEEESSDDEDMWSEDEDEDEDAKELNTVDTINAIIVNRNTCSSNDERDMDSKMFALILYVLNLTTKKLSDSARSVTLSSKRNNARTGGGKDDDKNNVDCRTLSQIHVSMWNILQTYYNNSPNDIQYLIELGFIPALMIFTKSTEADVRHSSSIFLNKLTLRFCFCDTALLLVKSGAIEAVCSLAEGISTLASSSSQSQPRRGAAATGLHFDFKFVAGANNIESTKTDEDREREVRNNCLAFLSNISRYYVVSSRIVKRGGLRCVIDCIRWDRYSSRNRHESDLLHVVALGIVKRCINASTNEIRLSVLKKAGPHDPTPENKETLQSILSKIIDRTHETIMMRILPSFTQMDTTITIRKYCIEILFAISLSTPESIEIEIESCEETEDKEENENGADDTCTADAAILTNTR